MKILVTGAAGFIGSNFVFHMRKAHPEYDIIALDSLTYAGNLETLAPVMEEDHFTFVRCDITDREGVRKVFEEHHPDVVVNFAAESHVDRSIEDPGVFLRTNILGTQVLMDACREFGIQRFHQVGTDAFDIEYRQRRTAEHHRTHRAGQDLELFGGEVVELNRVENHRIRLETGKLPVDVRRNIVSQDFTMVSPRGRFAGHRFLHRLNGKRGPVGAQIEDRGPVPAPRRAGDDAAAPDVRGDQPLLLQPFQGRSCGELADTVLPHDLAQRGKVVAVRKPGKPFQQQPVQLIRFTGFIHV